MAIVQCPNNHYYDNLRNTTCPYCEKLNSSDVPDDSLNEQLTSYEEPSEEDDDRLTEAFGESVQEYEKTIGIFTDETHNLLTVAWIVCIDGTQKGKSFVVHSGRNFAGRSEDMDIVLPDDNTVSRERHFSIVFDPKSIAFYLVADAGLTYINGESVKNETEIFDGDIIQAGKSKYIFVPFCKEGREWD